ncbi:sigma 54 modulation/S30EA ribosomal C-terminal domain-containing protein [Streptomyces sp. GC420]|uniref:sigma 54 modulation/S30EA ribosomal C-terminal domain-containing protein n=1 Tax=Streptomyces sp. GC420 TaxID=2697568 RepID=UPI0014152397|nr:sigma 54 modulation/S30EA ribosomal C-terminal domain-containing protein [Streptomyces sp. GC420]NBM20625.1 HPF/RaiA family ribosome-associated protein [Streptomyces sp. GC420]
MKRSASALEIPEIQVETRGQVPPDAARYAREKVQAVLGQTREPILFARVKLTRTANPATERPVIAQANVDVNGRPARAHTAGETETQAIDLLEERLSGQLARLAQHWEARRGKTTAPGEHEWRHGDEPTYRPDYYPRPVEERQVIRHKSFSLARETPDEAAFELESMDYGFHLFTDADSGEDSVLYRAGPTGYRLAQVRPHPAPDRRVAVPLTVSDVPAPRLDVEGAKQRLEIAGLPFVFFADAATGRGNVLYHRYDGHYGLITPVE